ncbi:MAG: glycosyltransferase [Synergistaceae bacterium]|jgi:glycosyltransferase involved in cell wall biosynthesis|nr:glycosyltransferase [Synergistaceae bacterium]
MPLTEKVMLILPELAEGGVERHVLSLSAGLVSFGYNVTVASAGGALVGELAGGVRHIEMPVDKKNFFTGMLCARRLADVVRDLGINVVHAHSRVPAWISYFVRAFTGVKFICTAHSRYSLNYGLWPMSKADGAICVSRSVRDHLYDWLPNRAAVEIIYNPAPANTVPWTGSGGHTKRLLILGRVSKKKGIAVVVKALSALAALNWVLDIVGEGPMLDEIGKMARESGIYDRITFHGHSDRAEEFVSACDAFLFPSFEEGLPLALIEALSAGAPVIASDIPAVRELTDLSDGHPSDELVKPGDVAAWTSVLRRFLVGLFVPSLKCTLKLPTEREMVCETIDFYENLRKLDAYSDEETPSEPAS